MVEKEKGTSKVKETIPHGNPETTLTVKNSKNNRSCKFCIIRHGKDIKAKTAYPIIDCGGRVHLPENTKQTVFGRASLAPTADDGIGRFSFGTLPCCKKTLMFFEKIA